MYTILGAGLSGISTADHLAKKGIPYTLYEGKSHGGGHVHSEVVDGFTWDEGPHVSFTKHALVKAYFEANSDNEFLEYAPQPTNYFKGDWIPHPAQSNLYAIPEKLRSKCVDDLVAMRASMPSSYAATNYSEWINYAFGDTFAKTFAKVYTEKYWTTTPDNLSTDWIGKRVYFPEISDMVESAKGPLQKDTHYISSVRYPAQGGFYSFIKKVEQRLAITYNKSVSFISFQQKQIHFADGEVISYERLINTLPLPQLIINSDAPEHIKQEARLLKCSQVLIINVVADHVSPLSNHWIYVYDEDFYATRVNFTELLSPANGMPGKTGIQVEVYFSKYHPIEKPIDVIVASVLEELVEMKLISSAKSIQSYHHKWIEWANVIFDKARVSAQDAIFSWMESFGLVREQDDLEPMTDWERKPMQELGSLILAGRFAQWKYFWTDDCVLRGSYISKQVISKLQEH